MNKRSWMMLLAGFLFGLAVVTYPDRPGWASLLVAAAAFDVWVATKQSP